MISVSGAKGRVWFVLLVAAWLLPGTVARTPWKADEAYTYGLVQHIMDSGDWVVPKLGGEPFMQKPPVLFVTAAYTGKIFGGIFGKDTAIRLSIALFQILTLVFLGLGGRELLGRGKGWYAPVLFMGCLGFLQLDHMLICDVSLVTGFAIAFAGLAYIPRRPTLGGILLGTGSGMAFMSKGLIGPGLIGMTTILLPFCGKSWRSTGYVKCLAVAAVASLPWVLIWPLALYQRDHELFNQWFLDNNLGRFVGAARVGRPNNLGLGGERYPFYLVLPWFAWPAFPLFCLYFWKKWRGTDGDRNVAETGRQECLPYAARQETGPVEEGLSYRAGVRLCVVGLIVMVIILSVSRNSRTLYGLPMLVPACLLGGYGVELLSAQWNKWSRNFCFVVFGISIATAWVVWLALMLGITPGALQMAIQKGVPDYQAVFQMGAFVAALAATALWVCWQVGQPKDDSRLAAVNWCAGLSLCYLLVMTLFLPLVEANMSYRHLASLREKVAQLKGPVVSSGLGEPQRAMLEYYAGLTTTRVEVNPAADADWFLTQTDARTEEGRQAKGPAWKMVWESVHSRKELFRLYQRVRVDNAAATKP